MAVEIERTISQRFMYEVLFSNRGPTYLIGTQSDLLLEEDHQMW